jgi:glycerol-3-phosphate acyltransferase PlsX
MGGDNAPSEIIKGALEALPLLKSQVILVGDPAKILALLPDQLPERLSVEPASESVGMDEKPLDAYRKKKDSSLRVAANLVHDGKADAMISAGNTGACSATALLTWRQVPGIHRPAIASFLPNQGEGCLLLDAGASPDVDPEHFVEFAIMGRAYAQRVMGRPNPKVQLLNIGEEEGKGNAFAKQAYKLLAEHSWFTGNIEGKDIYLGSPDVVVCDAFVGNVLLKASEGVAELIVNEVRSQVPTDWRKIFYAPLKGLFAPLRKKVDYAEYGGSPLLGLNGLCMICHGRSNAKAIRNALLLAEKAVENQLVETIRQQVADELPETPANSQAV